MTLEPPAPAAPVPTDTAAAATMGAASSGSQAAPMANDRPAAPVAPPSPAADHQDTRRTIESKGWKTLDDAAKGYRELFAKFSDVSAKALSPPAPDAKAEEWDAFHAKLGRPEQAEGYELSLPPDVSDTLPYDAQKASQYKQWAHQAGLSPRQAQRFLDAAARDTARGAAEELREAQAAFVARAEQASAALERAWGPKTSDTFARQLQATDRFIRMNGGDALLRELKEAGVLTSQGHVLSPLIAQAMAKAGRAFEEDQFVTGERAIARRDPASTLYPTDPFRR